MFTFEALSTGRLKITFSHAAATPDKEFFINPNNYEVVSGEGKDLICISPKGALNGYNPSFEQLGQIGIADVDWANSGGLTVPTSISAARELIADTFFGVSSGGGGGGGTATSTSGRQDITNNHLTNLNTKLVQETLGPGAEANGQLMTLSNEDRDLLGGGGVTVTPGLTISTGAGNVAAGARYFTIANNGNADGTVGGTTLRSGIAVEWPMLPKGDTYGTIAYDATGTEFTINESR